MHLTWDARQPAAEPALPAALVVRLLEAVRPRAVTPAQVPSGAEARATRGTRARPETADAPDVPVHARSPDVVAPTQGGPFDPDTVARAARDVARRPSLAQQSNELIGHRPPPTAQQTLGSEVAAAAKTDCLKGGSEGYGKQGYGLFALPLLIVDAATGRCRD